MTTQTKRRTGRRLAWYVLGPAAVLICLPGTLYLCAVLLARGVLPYSLTEELLIACVFLSGAASGLAAGAGRGGRAMRTGLIMGGALAAAIVLLTLAAPGEGPLNAGTLRLIIAAAAGGAFGGALCVRRVKPSKSTNRRR